MVALLILSYFISTDIIENFADIKLSNWWVGEDSDEYTKCKNTIMQLIGPTDKNFKVYSVFGEPEFTKEPDTIYIQYSGEATFKDPSKFHINIIPSDTTDNNIIIPHAFFHIVHNNIDINNLLIPRIYNKTSDSKFCIFAVSNAGCKQRNEIFTELSKYKKVDSCGKHLNNMGRSCPGNHESSEYFDFISQYKFMICFENTSQPNYLTEKIINAYSCGTIPIYWGCPNISDYVNMDAILYLPKVYTKSDMDNLIGKIVYLDKNPFAYRKMYEQPFFKDGLPDEFNIEKIRDKLQAKIDAIVS